MTPLEWIDNKLNGITMYRLVLYYLLAIYVVALILGFFHILNYDPLYLLGEGAFITAVAWITNTIFSRVFKAPTNVESVYITALILTLIIPPASPASSIMFYAWAAILAMASKYIFAVGKKHIFNPAGIAVVFTSFAIAESADWWAGGTPYLFPIVFIGGILLVRKLRHADMIFSFFFAFILTTAFYELSSGGNVLTTLTQAAKHAPIFFFAFVMLTEPLTTPPRQSLRILYGLLVGALFAPEVHLLSVYFTPELALVAGNIFSYLVSPKRKYLLTLSEKNNIALDTYDFAFATDSKPQFKPGQYLEWTLPHDHPDNRGNRRYFTIASSPTESGLRLGVKFYQNGSTFKQTLAVLPKDGMLSAGSLAGDFTLPDDPKKKLVFIAGGIGITPFRSMIKYLMDKNEKRDIVCFYSNKTIQEIAYVDVFDEAIETIGLKMIYTLTDDIPTTWRGGRGFVNADMIKREAPDYKERYFYISGPHGMVSAFEKTLAEMGVPKSQIKVDFFPGFA